MKAWLFTLLISGTFLSQLKGQDSSFTYPKGLYTHVGGGVTIPTIGQKNEGPIGDGYLSGLAISFPIIEFHLKPNWSLQMKFGINTYRYNVNNLENFVTSDGYKVGNQDLNGSVQQFYLQTGLYKTIWQKGINYLETGLLLGSGFVYAKKVFYLGLKEKEGVFVGTGPFYDVKNIRYGLGELKRSKFHYGLSLRFKQMYKSNDGFYIDLQFLRFQAHQVVNTNTNSSKEGSLLLVSPTMGFIFKI